jgi:hypothetical protein
MAFIQDEVAYNNAVNRNIWQNANKTFHRTFERSGEVEGWLINIEFDKFWSKNDFALSLAKAYDLYGKLTEGQYNAVCKIIDKQAARQAEWDAKREADKNAKNATLEHVGVVGERMQFELTVVAVIEYDRPKFHYYDSGVGHITIMEDAAGNKVVYMNTLGEKIDDNGYMPAEKGDTVLFMAKVKNHGVRDGAKQTVVQRPTKIVVVKGEE